MAPRTDEPTTRAEKVEGLTVTKKDLERFGYTLDGCKMNRAWSLSLLENPPGRQRSPKDRPHPNQKLCGPDQYSRLVEVGVVSAAVGAEVDWDKMAKVERSATEAHDDHEK